MGGQLSWLRIPCLLLQLVQSPLPHLPLFWVWFSFPCYCGLWEPNSSASCKGAYCTPLSTRTLETQEGRWDMTNILRDYFLSLSMAGEFVFQRSCIAWSQGFKQWRIYGISSNSQRSFHSRKEEGNKRFIISHILNPRTSALNILFIRTSKPAYTFLEEIFINANIR